MGLLYPVIICKTYPFYIMSETTDSHSVTPVNIEDKMKAAYMEYAMSVIIGRALPDVRDGLKPVHRRILYAMSNLNVSYNRPYMKSARIVGEVIGKYHPHGDSAVYDATVRMAQGFSMRYPLVDGQGNFGSVDGDSAAAMRYTEVRMKRITQEMLADLDKETVDFIPNYDGSLQEPSVMPSRVPALLVNGSTGIAVGMATNIPPHNLREVINGLLYVIDNKDHIDPVELIKLVSGPDFPTAGIILGRKGIYDAYTTGRGTVKVRARTEVEDRGNGKESIIVSELPYTVNKARLIEKIAELVKDKKITGISDVRDESDRKGMRIVIELKKNEDAEVVQASLFKHTAMQNSFGIIMLAVVNGQPKVLPLGQVLKLFLEHRVEIIVRRTRYDLGKAEERAHILQGLKVALDNIDDVVQLVRSSSSGAEAKERLIERFSLSGVQAQSILDMRLQKLTGLERDKLEEELKEILEKIEKYKAILSDEGLVLDIIRQELHELDDQYGDERRTEIIEDTGEINIADLIAEESMVVTVSREGYIKRLQSDTYQSQNRGGKGKIGMATKEEDNIQQMLVASTHDTLLMFSNHGKVYWKKVYELPLASRTAKGRAMVNLLPLAEGEQIMSYLPVPSYDIGGFVVMITRSGIIKKTELSAYSNERSNGTKAIVIDEGDDLVSVRRCGEEDLIFIATRNGLSLKFLASGLRSQGRVTRGSKGISLKTFAGEKDYVVSMEVISHEGEGSLLTVTEKGFGKKSSPDTYRMGKRGNVGVLNLKIAEKNGQVVNSLLVTEEDELMLMTESGKIIRIRCNQIRETGRVAQGVRLIQMDENERVVAVARILANDDEIVETEEDQENGAEESTNE